jgi:hypothetical protein
MNGYCDFDVVLNIEVKCEVCKSSDVRMLPWTDEKYEPHCFDCGWPFHDYRKMKNYKIKNNEINYKIEVGTTVRFGNEYCSYEGIVIGESIEESIEYWTIKVCGNVYSVKKDLVTAVGVRR